MKKVDTYLKEAVTNIREDRATTLLLLNDLMIELKKAGIIEMHKELGVVAAKYVETLQRSNEQLVKVAALLQKKAQASDELTDADKNELFDMIKEEVN